MKIYFLTFLTLILLSCKKNTVNTDLLIGEWEFSSPKGTFQIDSLTSKQYVWSDFSFEKDSVYNSHDGFFDRYRNSNGNYSDSKFLGNTTKYYIKNDSLYLMNILTKEYYSDYFISNLTKDSLVLESKDEPDFIFTKKKYKKASNVTLDQITLSKEPCFGSCPINSVSIDKDGQIYFYGESYNSKNGFFQGKINPIIFEELVKDLNKINFNHYKNDYGNYNITDLPSTSVSFIQEGKVYKSIYDYGNASPKELQGILTRISYLYQTTKLDTIKYNFPIVSNYFRNIDLQKSEGFYLQTLIMNAKVSQKKFKPIYFATAFLIEPKNFDYNKYDELKREVKTDGQFFQIEDQNHHYTTFDIGFNFFKSNEYFKNNKE